MSKISRKIGNQIRERRTAMKMTQEEFAKKAGFSAAVVSHWETGRRAFSIDSLEMIAFVLQCKVGDFFDEIKQPKKVLCPTCNGQGVVSELSAEELQSRVSPITVRESEFCEWVICKPPEVCCSSKYSTECSGFTNLLPLFVSTFCDCCPKCGRKIRVKQ